MVAELVFRSAVDQAAMIRAREVSSVELLESHLTQIERINPVVNAIVSIEIERARSRARVCDQQTSSGVELGLLHGLPTAHKDLVEVAGLTSTHGSPIFVDHVPATDDLIAERIKAAGAIAIGKTNVPEFGAGSQTFNRVFGVTYNPWDLSKTPGGSSGGAAVALATGMIPIADGSDFGGSLRNPASFCNVVGFRPSPGLVPSWPKLAAWSVLSVEGPMGRSVQDVALQLAATAGQDLRSPVALSDSPEVFFGSLDRDLRGLRVAWTDDLDLPTDPAVVAALGPARRLLEEAGARVEEAAPDLGDAGQIFQVLRAAQMEISLGELYDQRGDEFKDTLQWNIAEARDRPLTDLTDALRAHGRLYHRVREFFQRFDVLALPVTQVPPFDVDLEWVREIDGVQMSTYIDWMRSCSDISLTTCPAISVPAGFTDEGLPVGIQLVGPHRSDMKLLRIARAFEKAIDVGARRPPLIG
ncbi:MAG TPA: amidase [Actinobacteria bacterium]|nr:amidase [Actinomycetota bacterium]